MTEALVQIMDNTELTHGVMLVPQLLVKNHLADSRLTDTTTI